VQRSVQDLLERGERVEREVEVGSARLVVTDRRLLAFTPAGDGPNYRTIARPNVQHVEIAPRNEFGYVKNGVLYLLIGLATVAAGVVLDTDGVLSDTPTGPGASRLGVGDLVQQVSFWVGLVDDGIVVLGVIFALPTVYHVVRYQQSRRTVLSVGVAGDDDVDLPIERVDDPSGALEQLRLALDLPTGEADETAPEWTTTPD
jgi:hypothetical protein